MKKVVLFTAFLLFPFLGQAGESSFFLSSDPVVLEKQGSLKNLSSFVFFPLLKIEDKNAEKTMELIAQELKKIGHIVKKQVLTAEGADLECFSNPTIQFSIEQLVDSKNTPLPILQVSLRVRRIVEMGKGETTFLSTNHWSMYLKKTDDVQKVIKEILPSLLNQFIADFKGSHSLDEKPTFYITYDSSWWKVPKSK